MENRISIHEKIISSIEQMLVLDQLPYYGQFNLCINFYETERIETCGVNVTSKGMNFYYSPTFLDKLTQNEVNFIVLHEDFHLLFDHHKRTSSGLYDPKLANIAQDMIINHIIWEEISHSFVEIPKDESGKNMGVFVPDKYTGNLIFEELYDWLLNEKDEWEKGKNGRIKEKGKGEGDLDYGPYGKAIYGEKVDTWSIESIFENLEKNGGEYLDKHQEDTIPSELRETIIKEVKDRLVDRGMVTAGIESVLNKLTKKRKDYLGEIKRSVANLLFGTNKVKTIVKPNRRGIMGLKGSRKMKSKINVILDTSGSMTGLTESVLNYVYRNDIEINLIQADTEVKSIENIKTGKKLENIRLVGFGGTILQPAIDRVIEDYNLYNNVILTDGYCDTLDISRVKGKTLIISAGKHVEVFGGICRQILVDDTLK